MAHYIKYTSLHIILNHIQYIYSFPNYFPNYINPNPPRQLPCGMETREPVELKTHDIRQSVDELLQRAIKCSIPGLNGRSSSLTRLSHRHMYREFQKLQKNISPKHSLITFSHACTYQ